jgi:hypothetical protein
VLHLRDLLAVIAKCHCRNALNFPFNLPTYLKVQAYRRFLTWIFSANSIGALTNSFTSSFLGFSFSLFARRPKNVMLANALDSIAERDRIWSEQYLADQQRNCTAYDLAANSPAMNALRNEAARRKAIEGVAYEFGLTFADAKRVYLQAETERGALALKPAAGQTVA